MTLIPESKIREVPCLTQDEINRIQDFLQGAVYSWCMTRGGEWFGLRDLMGGKNFFWNGTPMIVLYERRLENGLNEDEAIEAAGKDGGWILKKMISNDRRPFQTRREYMHRQYSWTENDGDIV